jgi:hypothetical protein
MRVYSKMSDEEVAQIWGNVFGQHVDDINQHVQSFYSQRDLQNYDDTSKMILKINNKVRNIAELEYENNITKELAVMYDCFTQPLNSDQSHMY